MNTQKNILLTTLSVTLWLLPAVGVFPQSADRNYIVTQTYTSTAAHNDVIQYYDGLGRPVQTVQKQFTPSGKDLVTRKEYDSFGRESKNWLPINNNNNTGNFDNTTNVAGGYDSDAYAYSETKYEPSPLNRVDEQYGPGKAWRDNTRRVKTEYLANTTSGDLVCALYTMPDQWTLRKGGNYTQGSLYVTKITDEDNNISYEFKDKLGRVLLQRQMDGTTQNNTYYVYDDFGNLCFVLPPMASEKLTDDNTNFNAWGSGAANEALTNYGYRYVYDYRNRMIAKTIPGADVENYVYDKADRLVMTQTAACEVSSGRGWLFNKYDALGRLILSGIYTGEDNSSKDSNTRAEEMKNYFNNNNIISKESTNSNSNSYYYTNSTFPTNQTTVTQVNYYDDYVYVLQWDANLKFNKKTDYGDSISAKGLLTGTRSRLLSGANGNDWITTVYYYDYKGNVVQKRSTNQLGGYDNEYYAYNYNNLMTKKYIEHSTSYQYQITEEYGYEYDAQLRPTKVTYKFNGATTAATIAQYTYDDLGRMKTKSTGGVETATYAYNLRGWLESSVGDKFEEKLSYTSNVKSGGKTYFGGNIASLTWKTQAVSATIRGYDFEYDALGRLKNANYGETANLSSTTKNYSESFSYDKQGNPSTLKRYGRKDDNTFALIDNLTMSAYIGNCLREVKDLEGNQNSSDLMEFKDGNISGAAYIYNSSGALSADYNRKICQFTYNYLLLPQSIQYRYGHRIEYVYDATGMKRTVTYKESNRDLNYYPWDNRVPAAGDFLPSPVTRQYMSNKVYENNKLKYILTEEGYIEMVGNSGFPYYYLKDHLGNNRIVLDITGTPVQVTNYYPSGVTIAESPSRTDQGIQPYKFGNKELDRFKGLDYYDFVARPYDPTLMRFTRPDPSAEKNYSVSMLTAQIIR